MNESVTCHNILQVDDVKKNIYSKLINSQILCLTVLGLTIPLNMPKNPQTNNLEFSVGYFSTNSEFYWYTKNIEGKDSIYRMEGKYKELCLCV